MVTDRTTRGFSANLGHLPRIEGESHNLPGSARDVAALGSTQKLHSRRTLLRRGGFTLVELMVVLAVLSILAAAALTGYRKDQYSGQYKRFVDDARGVLYTARNAAIDDQTLVEVRLSSTELRVLRLNQATDVWELIERVSLDTARTRLIEAGQNVCVFGLVSGVQTPRQAADLAPPNSCLAGTQTLRFHPDGSFTDPDGSFTTMANVGATLWIANQELAGDTRLAIIEIFPGGLIRAFDKTEASGA